MRFPARGSRFVSRRSCLRAGVARWGHPRCCPVGLLCRSRRSQAARGRGSRTHKAVPPNQRSRRDRAFPIPRHAGRLPSVRVEDSPGKVHLGCPGWLRWAARARSGVCVTEGAPVALPRIVSLFSGAGGLDLGFHDEGYEVAFAMDRMTAAIKTHQRNFPGTKSVAADITQVNPATSRLLVLDEIDRALRLGEAIAVIGGPPCQGFSRANTKSNPNDPRNRLPLLYLQIVESLQERYDVQFVLFENVVGIRDAKHAETFAGILAKFEQLGLSSGVDQHSALDYGVPQTRNRVIITGFKDPTAAAHFRPQSVESSDLSVRGAIGGLPAPVYFSRGLRPAEIPYHSNHWTMRPRSKRFAEAGGATAGARSFRRLSWDKPSPTVAYGHREIHVHPDGTRRLSIYEAMMLQGFPPSFVLEGTLSEQVEQVSNAVPPPLARALARAAAVSLERDRESGNKARLRGPAMTKESS